MLTICLAVLHYVLGHVARAERLGLPFEIHGATADHGRLQHTGRLWWLLHLQLHQLLVVAIEIAGAAEVRPAVRRVHCAYLQLCRNTIRCGLLLDRDSVAKEIVE